MAPLQGEGSRYQALVRTCPGSRDHVPGPGACLRGMTRAWVLLPSRVPLGIRANRTPARIDAATRNAGRLASDDGVRRPQSETRRSRDRSATHPSTAATATTPTAPAT